MDLAPPIESSEPAPVPDAAVAALAAGLEAQACELGALATIVAAHGAQLQRYEGLHEAIGSLQQQMAELSAAAAAAAVIEAPTSPPEPVAATVAPMPEPTTTPTPAAPLATTTAANVTVDGRRTSLMAIGLALMCWSGLIWFGTGSATLALVSFVAANVIGCLALQPTREQPDR
jgi:hypothetical protein